MGMNTRITIRLEMLDEDGDPVHILTSQIKSFEEIGVELQKLESQMKEIIAEEV